MRTTFPLPDYHPLQRNKQAQETVFPKRTRASKPSPYSGNQKDSSLVPKPQHTQQWNSILTKEMGTRNSFSKPTEFSIVGEKKTQTLKQHPVPWLIYNFRKHGTPSLWAIEVLTGRIRRDWKWRSRLREEKIETTANPHWYEAWSHDLRAVLHWQSMTSGGGRRTNRG